jgi:hypothetical protein
VVSGSLAARARSFQTSPHLHTLPVPDRCRSKGPSETRMAIGAEISSCRCCRPVIGGPVPGGDDMQADGWLANREPVDFFGGTKDAIRAKRSGPS